MLRRNLLKFLAITPTVGMVARSIPASAELQIETKQIARVHDSVVFDAMPRMQEMYFKELTELVVKNELFGKYSFPQIAGTVILKATEKAKREGLGGIRLVYETDDIRPRAGFKEPYYPGGMMLRYTAAEIVIRYPGNEEDLEVIKSKWRKLGPT